MDRQTGAARRFADAQRRLGEEPARRRQPRVGDFDHDGVADLLVGSNAGPTYVQTYSGNLKDSAGLPQEIGTPIYPNSALFVAANAGA
jgi:hypothetical protein